jgi:hypothetical protein
LRCSAAFSGFVRYFLQCLLKKKKMLFTVASWPQWPLVVNNIVENWFYCRAALQASCVEVWKKGG